MPRVQMRHAVKDAAGNVIQNALCHVYLTTTTTPVSDMFAAESGGAAITTLTSNDQGEVVAYFDAAKTVDVKTTDNSDAAYYPSQPSQALSFADFTEVVQVGDVTAVPLASKGVANGVPSLDGAGFIPDAQIPAAIARDTEVTAAINAVINAAPGALDTLGELSDALGDDPNFATTITNLLAAKAGTGLSFITGSSEATLSDEKVLGTAVILPPGPLASVPAAASTVVGALYPATDGGAVGGVYRNTGSVWERIAALTPGAYSGAGLFGDRPAAGATNTDGLYLATDVFGGTPYRSNGSSWVQFAMGVNEEVRPLFARKLADQSKTSDNTLADDNNLSVSVEPNSVYDVALVLRAEGGNGDLGFDFTMPSGASFLYVESGHSLTAAANTDDLVRASAAGTPSKFGTFAGTVTANVIRGVLTTAAAGGAFTLKWAQETSSGTATTLKANSYMVARKQTLPTFVVKAADESVTSSTSLQDDNELIVPVEALAVYDVSVVLRLTGATGGDFKYNFTGPSGATFLWASNEIATSGTTTANDKVAVGEMGVTDGRAGTIDAVTTAVICRGVLVVGGTTGVLTLRWAQDMANATATTVKAGSFIDAQLVG